MCVGVCRGRKKVEIEMHSMLDITGTGVRNAHGESCLFFPMFYANEVGCLLQQESLRVCSPIYQA